MQLQDFVERRFIQSAPHHPRFVAIAVQVALAHVLNPNEAFRGIVEINLWNADRVLIKKLGDLDVVTILFPLGVVPYLTRMSDWIGRGTERW